MPEEEQKIVVTEVQLKEILDKIASIAVGFNWKHGATVDVAFSSANTTLVAHCYYLHVPHTEKVDSVIRSALLRAVSTYYTRTGQNREHPVGDQAVDFSSTNLKLI